MIKRYLFALFAIFTATFQLITPSSVQAMGWEEGSAEKIALHAAVGAAGAVAGEIAAEAYLKSKVQEAYENGTLTEARYDEIRNGAIVAGQIAGGIAGASVGGDAGIASEAAKNAAENNAVQAIGAAVAAAAAKKCVKSKACQEAIKEGGKIVVKGGKAVVQGVSDGVIYVLISIGFIDATEEAVDNLEQNISLNETNEDATTQGEDGEKETIGGIDGVSEHPDGTVGGGKKPQKRKDGGVDQAKKDFEKTTNGDYVEIEDGKLRGTGENGEDIIFNPKSSGSPSPSGLDGGIPTIYVDGTAIRYD